MKPAKFYFEIDCHGEDASDGPMWRGYDVIITDGNTLDDLLDNAQVFLVDQDGGEAGDRPADAQWMIEAITERYGQEIGITRTKFETHNDFMARLEKNDQRIAQ